MRYHLFIPLISFVAFFFFVGCGKSQELRQDDLDQSEYLYPPGSSTIRFSGYTWTVRNTTGREGPMNNYWGNRNVWVDADGNLHLRVTKEADGRWTCGEIISQAKFGYGTYIWELEGRVDQLDKNLVLGLFSYRGFQYTKNDEIDIEFARWGNSAWPNLNYTTYPEFEAGQSTESNPLYINNSIELTLAGTKSTHVYRREQDVIHFSSYNGYSQNQADLLHQWNTSQQTTKPDFAVTKVSSNVHMNLWLFDSLAPSDGKEVVVVVKSFKFIPQ